MGIIFSGAYHNHVFGEPYCHIGLEIFITETVELQVTIHYWECMILSGIKYFHFILRLMDIINIIEIATEFVMRLSQFFVYSSIAVRNDAPSARLLLFSL